MGANKNGRGRLSQPDLTAQRCAIFLAATVLLCAADAATEAASPESTSLAMGWHALHASYFQRNWGVDVVGVHPVASGAMLEFRYVVLDPAKARQLNDTKSVPTMIDRASGTRLQVPAMENIGTLRQSTAPKAGRMYWIVFGNPGHRVHRGSQVDVEIGAFRAEELIVD